MKYHTKPVKVYDTYALTVNQGIHQKERKQQRGKQLKGKDTWLRHERKPSLTVQGRLLLPKLIPSSNETSVNETSFACALDSKHLSNTIFVNVL